MGRLADKIALITGAANGIGLATAQRFAEEGAQVVLTDVAEAAGEAAARGIVARGGRALFLVHDASDEAAWTSVLGRIEREFGRLDVLVNNAYRGIGLTISSASLEDFQDNFRVTANGVFLGIKLAAPLMEAGGSIINMSSIAAHMGAPKNPLYSAAKASVSSLTRSAALALARRGVRVNAVAPGLTRTAALERHLEVSEKLATPEAVREAMERLGASVPMGRIAEPEEIANVILFLASDEASFVTGAEFVVDGGSLQQ
jgi:NAD(P)-dependent dehydrogenase (short-subunit alcohol dehydrogenase family)